MAEATVAVMEGDLKKIRDAVLRLASEEAQTRLVHVQKVEVGRVQEPEEEWWEIAFNVAVDAVAEDALAYWQGLERRVEQWAETQTGQIQELLAHHIAISVEWVADGAAV